MTFNLVSVHCWIYPLQNPFVNLGHPSPCFWLTLPLLHVFGGKLTKSNVVVHLRSLFEWRMKKWIKLIIYLTLYNSAYQDCQEILPIIILYMMELIPHYKSVHNLFFAFISSCCCIVLTWYNSNSTSSMFVWSLVQERNPAKTYWCCELLKQRGWG